MPDPTPEEALARIIELERQRDALIDVIEREIDAITDILHRLKKVRDTNGSSNTDT